MYFTIIEKHIESLFDVTKIKNPEEIVDRYFWEPSGSFSGWEPNLKDMEFEIEGIDGETIVEKFWPIFFFERVVICKMKLFIDKEEVGFSGWAVGSIHDTGSVDFPPAGFVLAKVWQNEQINEHTIDNFLSEITEYIEEESQRKY